MWVFLLFQITSEFPTAKSESIFSPHFFGLKAAFDTFGYSFHQEIYLLRGFQMATFSSFSSYLADTCPQALLRLEDLRIQSSDHFSSVCSYKAFRDSFNLCKFLLLLMSYNFISPALTFLVNPCFFMQLPAWWHLHRFLIESLETSRHLKPTVFKTKPCNLIPCSCFTYNFLYELLATPSSSSSSQKPSCLLPTC